MIIKAGKTGKRARFMSIKKRIDYVFDPNKMRDLKYGRKPVVVKRFLKGYDADSWVEQILENDSKRSYNHKKRIVIRSEFISFSDADNQLLTEDILRLFAEHYLKTRSRTSLGLAVAHYDTDSCHLHFLLTGCGVDSKSTSIRKSEYEQFKKDFQKFQISHHPELSASIVKHGKKKQNEMNLTHEERMMIKRGVASDKVRAAVAINKIAMHCKDMDELVYRLKEELNIKVYYRKGKVTGIEYRNRKLRFTTLGMTSERVKELRMDAPKKRRTIQR